MLVKFCIAWKNAGKLAVTNNEQQINAIALDQESLTSAISKSHNNSQFHYAIISWSNIPSKAMMFLLLMLIYI